MMTRVWSVMFRVCGALVGETHCCVFACVVVVVVVVVPMVAVGLVVLLMVAVGVLMLVIVVRVLIELYIGVVKVVGELCREAKEMDCTRVVDIMVLGGGFVVMVEGVELVMGCVVRLVLWFENERVYFLCCFSLMLVEMNGQSAGGCFFGMVIWSDCFSFWNVIFLRGW